MALSSRGRSRPTIWVCRARVAVETSVGLLLTSACAISGIRYASDFPVPVPGLDEQMVAGLDGARHLPGHLVLPAAALAAHAGHGTVEQFDDALLAGSYGGAGTTGRFRRGLCVFRPALNRITPRRSTRRTSRRSACQGSRPGRRGVSH